VRRCNVWDGGQELDVATSAVNSTANTPPPIGKERLEVLERTRQCILLVGDDLEVQAVLRPRSRSVLLRARTLERALAYLRCIRIDVVVVECGVPSRAQLGLLEELRTRYPSVRRVVTGRQLQTTELADLVETGVAQQLLPRDKVMELLGRGHSTSAEQPRALGKDRPG